MNVIMKIWCLVNDNFTLLLQTFLKVDLTIYETYSKGQWFNIVCTLFNYVIRYILLNSFYTTV